MSLVTRRSDGQLGRLVEIEGRPMVRLDRPGQELFEAYDERHWLPAEKRPIGPMQVKRVCYEADRALRHARGEYGVKQWEALPEHERIRMGTPADPERGALWDAITEALT